MESRDKVALLEVQRMAYGEFSVANFTVVTEIWRLYATA